MTDLQSRQGATSSTHSRSRRRYSQRGAFWLHDDRRFFVVDRHPEDAGIGDNTNGLVILDVATRYLHCEASESRDIETTEINLLCFAGDVKVRRFYSDNDDALIAAARNLKWKHDFSKPHDLQSNGLIESHVGFVKAGAHGR